MGVRLKRVLRLLDAGRTALVDGDGAALVVGERDGVRDPDAAARQGRADAAGWLAALQSLLPRGLAWRRDADATLTRLLAAVADGMVRLHDRALTLLDEADPRTCRALLAEWEAFAGLPDPCAGQASTLQERRRRLVARLTWRGGQRIADLEAVAVALGYTVTITESPRFRCGHAGRCGRRLGGPIAAHTLRVAVTATPVWRFRVGTSVAGDRLGAFARHAALECSIRRAAPAHAIVIFAYGG